MKYAYLDGAAIGGKRALHDALAEQLGFPEWYGRNLDALYDLLGEESEPVCIVIHGREAMEARLGGYFRVFLGLLRDLAEEGHDVSVIFNDINAMTTI